MNAYLLAAGNGSRLGKLTLDTPKCLLPVGGKPILEWWLDAVFATEEFRKVYVNAHHLADHVERWIWRYAEKNDVRVEIIDERSGLLGTGGTLFWHGDSSDEFMAVYTDTFSRRAMGKLFEILDIWWTEPDETLAGLLAFDSPKDGSSGSIQTNKDGEVVEFREKADREDAWSWAGVMFGRKEFFSHIRQGDIDLARDVFPRLNGRMRVLAKVDAYDIGRGAEHYERFNREFDFHGFEKSALQA